MEKIIKLNYCQNNNFGDELSPYLIEKITGRKALHYTGEKKIGSLYAIGSIINYEEIRSGGLIWGSGVMTRKSLKLFPYLFPVNRTIPKLIRRIKDNKEISCDIRLIRGRLSRNLLLEEKVNCPEIFGDPAIVVRRFYTPSVPSEPRYDFGLICHKSQEGLIEQKVVEKHGGCLISIQRQGERELEKFISEINLCKKIFSSSLHGLMMGHVYGVPAQWVQVKNKKIHRDQEFKFYDYFTGVEISEERPIIIDNESIAGLKDFHPRKVVIEDRIVDRVLAAFPFDALR